MSSRTKKNIFDFLFEGEDHKSATRNSGRRYLYEGEDSDESKDEPKDDDEGDDDDIDLDKIKDLVGQLQSALGGEEAGGDEDLNLGDDEDSDSDEKKEKSDEDVLDEDDMNEMYTETELDEMDNEGDMYEMDAEGDMMNELDAEGDMHDEMDMHEMHDEGDMHEMDAEGAVYEIDESALRRELHKMKNLRESRKIRENAAVEQADQFGGGEELGDVFYDIDEDKLINVLADELGAVKHSAKAAAPAHKNESLAVRKALSEAAEYKKAAQKLQAQLVEMNLFNAKLLYANKLMQNKNLTVKQQRAIVEALDNAKTLREAKLLYKSLSESLARRGQASGNLSEGATRTVLGSSSRSTRSAQPATSGVEVDRWATLAGIKGETK